MTMRMPTLRPFGEGCMSGEVIDTRTRLIRRGSGHGTSKQESVEREIRTRSTWRGLETWHGRDAVTLADERARQQATRNRPKPARQSSTLPMSGDGKRSDGQRPQVTAPILNSTLASFCEVRSLVANGLIADISTKRQKWRE